MTYTTFACAPSFTEEGEHRRAEIVSYLAEHYPHLRQGSPREADLLLVFGGDGTILEAIRSVGMWRPHILAFNTGNKGFLATVREADRFTNAVDMAISGVLPHLDIPLVQMNLIRGSEQHARTAVNDIFIDCTMTWLDMSVSMLRGSHVQLIKRVKGSGICIASAIGSTTPMARHFGCPAMDPNLRAFYMKVTNDISMAPGLALSGDGRMRITLNEIGINPGIPKEIRHPPGLFIDGIHAHVLQAGDVIDIEYLNEPVAILRQNEDSHWDRVNRL